MNLITFSRKMGTKGTDVAGLVAGQLGYSFYDTEDIEKKARDMGFLDEVRAVDDKAPPPLKRLFSYRPEMSLDRLYMVIYELARSGNAVILGRGGNMLFRSVPSVLNIRIIASREKRIHNLAEKGYERTAAIAVMEKSDHERESFVKFAFHRDWEDPGFYDILLNMDDIRVETAAALVLHAARSDEFQGRAADTVTSLDMMELSVKVSMALAKAGFPSSYISTLVSEPGKVRLRGVVQVPWERSAAERKALEVEGVKSVENNIEIAGG